MDLSEFVTQNSYDLGNTAFFCDHENTSPDMSYPDVFWEGFWLEDEEVDPIGPIVKAGDPITYNIYVDVARKRVVPAFPPQNGFDLRQKPEDVCFYLAGGNESGRGYRSNKVMVPKAAISEALQTIPPT